MTVSDYDIVRKLLPKVSTCVSTHSEDDITYFLSLPTYHPFVAFREDTGELVGFAEIYRLPHLGRSFDARLERVITTESFRGQGLATRMCECLIDLAKTKLNCNRIDLTVEKADARHIYETKLQFKHVNTTLLRLTL